MTTLTFRPADKDDVMEGTDLVMETLGQFGDYQFGFGSHDRKVTALRKFFLYPGNRFSHTQAIIAEVDGKAAGILMNFDRQEMRRAMWVTAFQLLRVYNLSEAGEFISRIWPYRDAEEVHVGELYIAHLAVKEGFRRQGIGMRILHHAEKRARDRGLGRLSLMTEMENAAARALYVKIRLFSG